MQDIVQELVIVFSGGRCTGCVRTNGRTSTLLFEFVVAYVDGKELVCELVLVVVLISPFETSIVFDNTSEPGVKE